MILSLFIFQLIFLKIDGSDIFTKIDTNKPIGKALKFIQIYLSNRYLYIAEKLSKSLKTNKSEFLRLLALYPKVNNVLIKEILISWNKSTKSLQFLILRMIYK